jgi:hypothetical protein
MNELLLATAVPSWAGETICRRYEGRFDLAQYCALVALYGIVRRCQSKILNTWRGHRTAQIDPGKSKKINGREIRF